MGATPATPFGWMRAIFNPAGTVPGPIAREASPTTNPPPAVSLEIARPDRARMMTADELRTHRAYPRLFDLDGTPVRVLSKAHLPEIYAGEGQWQTLPAQARLLIHGRYVTRKRFAALCARFDQFLDNGGPFVEPE